MSQEVMPQAHPFMRPLDNPRNIHHHKRLPAVLDHTQHRLQRRKRVVRHLWPCRAHNRQQARLPGVRQADYAHIRQQLQLKPQVQRLTRLTLLRKQRVLVRRRCEVCVAPSTAAAMRQVHVCPGVVRSASISGGSESASHTCVPTGIRIKTFSPSAPCFSADAPLRPSPAANRRSYRKANSVFTFSSQRAMIFPPLPPSPPSGPPRGTNFSRRPLTAPSPPLPLLMWITTSSIIGYSWIITIIIRVWIMGIAVTLSIKNRHRPGVSIPRYPCCIAESLLECVHGSPLFYHAYHVDSLMVIVEM